MTKNLAWACQIRAAAGVAEGKVRRLKEKIDRLTTFEVSWKRIGKDER
jgi:hypothetical protein